MSPAISLFIVRAAIGFPVTLMAIGLVIVGFAEVRSHYRARKAARTRHPSAPRSSHDDVPLTLDEEDKFRDIAAGTEFGWITRALRARQKASGK